MSIDALTVTAGLGSFACFFLVHVITFRWLPPERLLQSLLLIVLAVMALPAVLMALAQDLKIIDVPWGELACAAGLGMLINGLACFVYVLCIFGPYETSVRMRLVREIALGGTDGLLHQELLGRYNAETIVEIRLRRLLGSGDIIEKDGLYRCGRPGNFFFVFDIIAGALGKWIGR
jgi:hypothetical protein